MKSITIPPLREFIRLYGRPYPIRNYPEEDPRPKLLKYLEEGKTSVAIESFDETDSRCLNGLTWAHQLNDSLEDAERLACTAINVFSGDLATAISHLACVKMRRSDNEACEEAFELFKRAISIRPDCHTAHCNRLCYASRLRNTTELDLAIADLITCVPSWATQTCYTDFLADDADLAWARSQPSFAKFQK
jgi:hypothetical protein